MAVNLGVKTWFVRAEGPKIPALSPYDFGGLKTDAYKKAHKTYTPMRGFEDINAKRPKSTLK